MSTTVSASQRRFSLAWLRFVMILATGNLCIHMLGFPKINKTYTFWVPTQAKFLTEVDGLEFSVSEYTPASPVVTTALGDFMRISKGRVVDLTIAPAVGHFTFHKAMEVHYSTAIGGTNYHAKTYFTRRADDVVWEKGGTVTFTGTKYWETYLAMVAWFIFLTVAWFNWDKWLHALRTKLPRHFRKQF